jgi:hypothetical protein
MTKENEVEISTQLTVDELVARIGSKTKAISSCLAYAIATSYEKHSHLVGEVNRHRLVLARARPLANSTSKPVFVGTITNRADGSSLRGVFEVNCFRRYFFWSSTVILVVAELFIVLSIFSPDNQPVLQVRNIVAIAVLPVLQGAAYLFSKFTKDKIFEDDKKWIEDELRRILVSS